METIRIYVENMFMRLPQTKEMQDLKEEILSNMEDKYNELKAQGKSENEAIGTVISEFGNIDEIMQAYNLKPEDKQDETEIPISHDEVVGYLDTKKQTGILVGIGTFCCILAPALLIFVAMMGEITPGFSESTSSVLGVCCLLLLVGVGVALFIYSGAMSERYKYIEKGSVTLSYQDRAYVQELLDRFRPTFTVLLIVAILGCIFSPIPLLISSVFLNEFSAFSVCILLVLVAICVFLFIFTGTRKEAYERLLQINEYSKKNKESERIISVVASIVWPLVAGIYVIGGFVWGWWGRGWIIFVVTGILFGIFSSIVHAVKGDSE
ncbi:permease prefix domain 1-containing protein [Anaerolentibacter hominis]|uniref:permease prefix domain 1-containing protein n=1 Tax=Anaerolentibacter hominis TaxID=3079009 RepID=UPI0031B7EE5D